MNFDFELLLTILAAVSGVLWLIDAQCFAKKRVANGVTQQPLWAEYARSFFPIFLIVLLLRSFLAEPYRIPSGSDQPTLQIGDFLIANKFAYGLRLPVLHNKIVAIGEPQRGDIVLFRHPANPSMDLIKRVIGVPGDRVEYIDKVLLINGKAAPQTLLGQTNNADEMGREWPVYWKQEDLLGVKHQIYLRVDTSPQDFALTVPPGQYFVMGDNRDNSSDSRYWGFMPEENLVGKAYRVIISWDSENNRIRWNRIGMLIV